MVFVATRQNGDQQPEETPAETPAQETASETKKGAPTHAAPAEYKDLPKGEDGRPATIDNPVATKKGK